MFQNTLVLLILSCVCQALGNSTLIPPPLISPGRSDGGGGGDVSLGDLENVTRCQPTYGKEIPGFKADFYKYMYPLYDTIWSSENFLLGGYSESPDAYLGSVEGVTDLSFFHFYGLTHLQVTKGEINGFPITISNFSVAYSGYFKPPVTGEYSFTFGQTDDGSLLQVYLLDLNRCCPDVTDDSVNTFSVQSYDSTESHTAVLYMEEGFIYPMKVVYFNRDSAAIQTFFFEDPNGVKHDTFDGYVINYDSYTCPKPVEDEIPPPVITQSTTVVETLTITADTVTETVTLTTELPVETVAVVTTETLTLTEDGVTVTTVLTTELPERTKEVTLTATVTLDGELTTQVVTFTETLEPVTVPTTSTAVVTLPPETMTLTETLLFTKNGTTETDVVTLTVNIEPDETTVVTTVSLTNEVTKVVTVSRPETEVQISTVVSTVISTVGNSVITDYATSVLTVTPPQTSSGEGTPIITTVTTELVTTVVTTVISSAAAPEDDENLSFSSIGGPQSARSRDNTGTIYTTTYTTVETIVLTTEVPGSAQGGTSHVTTTISPPGETTPVLNNESNSAGGSSMSVETGTPATQSGDTTNVKATQIMVTVPPAQETAGSNIGLPGAFTTRSGNLVSAQITVYPGGSSVARRSSLAAAQGRPTAPAVVTNANVAAHFISSLSSAITTLLLAILFVL